MLFTKGLGRLATSDEVRTCVLTHVAMSAMYTYAKQKHLGCKKGEVNQKQQLSDYIVT